MAVSRSILVSSVLLALVSLTGCANRKQQQAAAPTYAPHPGGSAYGQQGYATGDTPSADYAYADVYVQDQYFADPFEQQPTDMIGYETMSTGEQVVVVNYVHTYPEPIETFPRVYWAGRWYYNVNGSFVFWDPYWGMWSYYWGPPAPLVVVWNYHYPWVEYCWGVGYYGPGWYWGGVGYYGYHAYGRPPSDWRPSHSPNGDPGGPTGGPDGGGPGGGGGGGGGGPTEPGIDSTVGVDVQAPVTAQPGRAKPAGTDVAAPGKPGRAPLATATPAAGTQVAAPGKPGRAPVTATPTVATEVASGRAPARRIEPSKPPRAPVVAATPGTQVQNPTRARVPQVHIHNADGVTTRATYSPPATRRAPTTVTTSRAVRPGTTPARQSTSLPSIPANQAPTYRTYNPSPSSSPSYTPTSSSPASYSPSSSPSRSSSPSSSSPSRSYSPSSSSPSRSSSPSSSSPSRSYSPSRSSSSPSRSYSPSSSPSRSYSPSRSSSPSPSRGSVSPSRHR